jgi:hypothetical protein
LFWPLACSFGRWQARTPRLTCYGKISSSSPLLGFASLIMRGATHSLSSPLRSSLPPALHSPLCGQTLNPRPAVHGGSGIIYGLHMARGGCSSSVSPTHGCCCSSLTSSSRRVVPLVGGVCLPRRGHVVDAASSFPSVCLLPLLICFLLPKPSACFMATSFPSPKQGEIFKCWLHLTRFQ